MATIAEVVADINEYLMAGQHQTHFFETLTETNADGTPIDSLNNDIVSVHCYGTFGSASFILQGSNDGTNYDVLTAALTADGFLTLPDPDQFPRWVRIFNSGGTGTDVDCMILTRGRSRVR